MKKLVLATCMIFYTLFTLSGQGSNSLASNDARFSNKGKSKVSTHKRRYIALSVKNTSSKTINCYVKGKKPEGGKFSYGFPMKPGQIRPKDWSIGSKVYVINKLGLPKLLTIIKPEDEHMIVDLFRSKS